MTPATDMLPDHFNVVFLSVAETQISYIKSYSTSKPIIYFYVDNAALDGRTERRKFTRFASNCTITPVRLQHYVKSARTFQSLLKLTSSAIAHNRRRIVRRAKSVEILSTAA